jgi:hypothetical protein
MISKFLHGAFEFKRWPNTIKKLDNSTPSWSK